MQKKNTKSSRDPFTGYDFYQEDILSAISFLNEQIEKIDSYPDKSLFFQDPRVIEGWLVLARAIEKIEKRGVPKNSQDWEQRTELYVASLITRRELYLKYKKLYKAYYNQLSDLVYGYSGWLDGYCISADASEALVADQYEPGLEVPQSINDFLDELNQRSLDARYYAYKALSDIFNVLSAVMNRGGQIVLDQNPSSDEFRKALDDDIREWTLSFGKQMFREAKEELNRHFKIRLTDPYSPELWGEMLRADEDALKMAMRQELAHCEDPKQEHWGEDMKQLMDENGELMRRIYSSCFTEELIDVGKTETVEPFIELLTADNLEMFYDIIVRRNLIQCGMYSELKAQHDEWLNHSDEHDSANQGTDEDEAIKFDEARQSKLDEIIRILQNGGWKQPATADNIKQLLNTVFGRDLSLLDKEDMDLCEKMWSLVEGGRGDRKMIVPANLAGFFADENLLNGSSKEISKDLFGNGNMVNSVNDGKKNNRSVTFEGVIPFLTKYTNKIIRKV